MIARPDVERDFPPDPTAPNEARAFVVDTLESWGSGGLAADAALVVSELATNAVRHVGGPFRVGVEAQEDGIRVVVADRSAKPPLLRDDRGAAGGFGLVIVDDVSHDWGVEDRGGDGKAVWAEIR